MSGLDSVFAVRRDAVHYVWQECVPLLAAALRRSGSDRDADYVLEQLLAETAQLWCACSAEDEITGAMVTQIEDRATGRACRIWLMGGRERGGWLHGLETDLAPWLRLIGCTSVEIDGRKGWARVLAPFGFRQKTPTLLEKPLG